MPCLQQIRISKESTFPQKEISTLLRRQPNTETISLFRWCNSEMSLLRHFSDSNKGPKKVFKVFLTFRTRTTGYPHEITGMSITTSYHTPNII